MVALCAIDNLVKGASGQAIQCANLLCGLDETSGLPSIGLYAVSVTAAKGFVAAGVAAGIKASGDPDLSLVATADGRAGGRGRRVHVQQDDRGAGAHLARAPRGHRRPGRGGHPQQRQRQRRQRRGRARARRAHVARPWPATCACSAENVLVCSTGLIGIPLPDRAHRGRRARAGRGRAERPEAGAAAAEAIRTTDTARKEAVVGRRGFTVGGMAKGAAMLAPNMATMLAVLTTDADVDPVTLKRLLRRRASTSRSTSSPPTGARPPTTP